MTFYAALGTLILIAVAATVLAVSTSRIRARRARARGVNKVSPFDFARADRERSFAQHPAGQGVKARTW